LLTPPDALLALVIAFSVLLAPIDLMSFFISAFLFSWNKSISMFLPRAAFPVHSSCPLATKRFSF
jgi:hypothetical protein